MRSDNFPEIDRTIDKLENYLDTIDNHIKSLKRLPDFNGRTDINGLQYGEEAVDTRTTVVKADGTITDISNEFLTVLGYGEGEVERLIGKKIEAFIADHLLDYFTSEWESAVRHLLGGSDKRSFRIKVNVFHKKEFEVPIHMELAGNGDEYFSLSVKDVSYRNEIEEELSASRENYRILAETATDAIIQIKSDLHVLFANSAVNAIFGFTGEEVVNNNIGMLFPESRYKNYAVLFEKYFYIDDLHRKDTGLRNSIEVLGQRKDGEMVPLEISFGNSMGIGGNRILTCIIRDIAVRKKAERRLRYLAFHDKLTSLGNRDRLHESLDHVISEIRRHPERRAALLFMDLDGFKKVNDSLGHEMGDMILRETAKRLSNCLREEDQVYRVQMEDIFRLGGDEFTLLLSSLRKPEDAAIVARRLIDKILEPFKVKGYGSITNINMGVSVGIALIPEDGLDKTTILRNADAAMYHAKEVGNSYIFFTKDMNNKALERLMLEEGLRKSIGTENFKLHYQPVVDKHGTILAVEALIRWNHPEKGNIPPEDFISIAEDTRLILPIGRWVLEAACRHLQRIHNEGYTSLHMNVNISPIQLERDDLAVIVQKTLKKLNMKPNNLTLELTETSIMNDPEMAIKKMNRLMEANRGIRIAIDDFGTGYSSLSYLSRFPVHNLKIDKSFVGNMDKENNTKIIDSILSLGRSLGLTIVAEGVEIEHQLEYLSANNCQAFQGYYFGKPMPIDALLKKLARVSSSKKKLMRRGNPEPVYSSETSLSSD